MNNYELLCDCNTYLGLTCVLPMLKVMQSLTKLAKADITLYAILRDLYCFIIANLYIMHVDVLKNYGHL